MRSPRLGAFLLIALAGCGGTRDSVNNRQDAFQINNTYSQGSKIVLGSSYTYEPVDPSKPYRANGQEFQNVKVTANKTETRTNWKNITVYRTRIIYRTKTVDRTNNSYLYLGLFGIFCGFVFLWVYLPKIKKP